jgi:hypothetical protein
MVRKACKRDEWAFCSAYTAALVPVFLGTFAIMAQSRRNHHFAIKGRVPVFSTEQRVVRQVWSGCSVQYGTRSHGRHGQHSTPGKPSIEYAGVFDPNEERAVSVNVWQAWGVRTGPLGWRVRAFLRDMLSHLLHVHTYCFHAFLRDMPRSIICVRPRLLCTFST